MTVGLLIRSLIPCVCRFQLCSRLVASRTEPSLLQPLNIDEVRLKFSTTEGEQIWFTSGTCTISPGVTPVTLFCPASLLSFPFDAPDGPSPVFLPQTAMSGRLALELSQIRFSRIIFQYSHRPVSNRNLAPDPRNLPLGGQQPIIHFPRDPQALNVYTELPRASQPNLYLPRLDYPDSDLSVRGSRSPPRSPPTSRLLHRDGPKSTRQGLAEGRDFQPQRVSRPRLCSSYSRQ